MAGGDQGAGPLAGLSGAGLRIGVVRARWNSHIVDRLANGVGRGLAALGVDPGDVVDETVPGSFELPMGALVLASSGRVDAVICLIGFLFPLWDAKRQTLADKILTTVVLPI